MQTPQAVQQTHSRAKQHECVNVWAATTKTCCMHMLNDAARMHAQKHNIQGTTVLQMTSDTHKAAPSYQHQKATCYE